MTAALLFGSLSLAACNRASARAERELKMMEEANATSGEKCVKKREIAQAYLSEGNQRKYEEAKLFADIDCFAARYEP